MRANVRHRSIQSNLALSDADAIMIPMKEVEPSMTMKVVKGDRIKRTAPTIWQRFDRLQKSVAPLRKGKRIRRGIHYGDRP
jgi:hypothetical protein